MVSLFTRRSTRKAVRAARSMMEPLEGRQMFSLLGIMPSFPAISAVSASQTATSYNATTDVFSSEATAISFRLSGASAPVSITGGTFSLRCVVNSSGNLVGGVAGDDLVLTGSIDVDGNGSIDYTGTLLTGEVTAMGSLEAGATDFFDFRLTPTGGALISFYSGKDIGVTITAEASTFTGSFASDFTAKTKAVVGPIQPNVGIGSAATIGFWHNKNGQALLRTLNGSASSTALSGWLATNFPNLWGANAGARNLTGKTNAQVADYFKTLHDSIDGMKLECQMLAVAFATYVTNASLAGGNYAASFGFTMSSGGTGAVAWNVKGNGAAFGVANNSMVTIFDLLKKADAMSPGGVLFGGSQSLMVMANNVFDGINNFFNRD